MILVHHTMSYLEPTNKMWNFVKFLWKCQDISIVEQFGNLGVHYIPDIHLAYMNPGWRFCCYSVDLGITHTDDEIIDLITDICNSKKLKIIIRLVLERQCDIDSIDAFNLLINKLRASFKEVSIDSLIKRTGVWTNKDSQLKYKRFNWKYWNINFGFWHNFKVWKDSKFITKKKFAKSQQVTDSMIYSKKYCYKVDFV